MVKHLLLAAFLTCGAATASAQPQQATSPRARDATTALPAGDMTAATVSGDTRKLIGRKVRNAQNETIGEITSVYIGPDGKVDGLIVGVGGVLGVGEREVRLALSDFRLSDSGEKVVLNMTEDGLKAKPEYKYSERGPWTAGDPSRTARDRAAGDRPSAHRDTASVTSTGDFNVYGEISGDAFIGTNVRNQNNEIVGKVEDVYIDDRGAIKTIVVSVGGFLGVGTKDVAVRWSDIGRSRDGKSLVLTTNWTRDSLMTMPEYKHERRQTQR